MRKCLLILFLMLPAMLSAQIPDQVGDDGGSVMSGRLRMAHYHDQ